MTGTPAGTDNLLFSPGSDIGGIHYILGSTDRGKTTLCRELIDRFSRRGRVAYLDLDPGQSVIGPPATLGLAFFLDGEEILTERCLRFAGSTSPRGHLLPILAGAKRLLERALSSEAKTVIIDSPGYIHDDVAIEFHLYLIDLLRPDSLIAIQEKDELEPILVHFRGHPKMAIRRVPPSPLARTRGSVERRKYREEKFREYFSGAVSRDLSLEGLGVHGRIPDPIRVRDRPGGRGGPLGRIPDTFHPDHWQGILVSLCDQEQWVVALGIVESIDVTTEILRIRAPEFDPKRITSVHVGAVRVEGEG